MGGAGADFLSVTCWCMGSSFRKRWGLHKTLKELLKHRGTPSSAGPAVCPRRGGRMRPLHRRQHPFSMLLAWCPWKQEKILLNGDYFFALGAHGWGSSRVPPSVSAAAHGCPAVTCYSLVRGWGN